jgi:hypothetical protein
VNCGNKQREPRVIPAETFCFPSRKVNDSVRNANYIVHDNSGDGVVRRGFLKSMAWAGTGLIWSVGGGVLSSRAFGHSANASATLPSAAPSSHF